MSSEKDSTQQRSSTTEPKRAAATNCRMLTATEVEELLRAAKEGRALARKEFRKTL